MNPKLIKLWEASQGKITTTYIERSFEQQIKKSMKLCPMKPLTKGQQADIKAYFKKYLKRDVPTYWHQYLYSRNDLFSVKYIPASVYRTSIVFRLNDFQYSLAYVDKGFYDTLFPDVNRPKTFVKNVNGFYYDDKQSISKEEAIARCSNLKEAIIKPTAMSSYGSGVQLFHAEDGFVPEMKMSINDLFARYKKSFIVQSKLEQHPDLARLNPTSVNTIRVLSYRRENEVVILYAVLRIGRKGKVVDNETAGGIKADIDLQTGRIKGVAFGGPKEPKMPRTDSGVELDNYLIPSFPQVLDFVKDLHFRLPYFRLIGWDVSVDSDGKPIMIEWNRSAELSQVAHGPAFGDYTEEIFAKALSERNTLIEPLSRRNRPFQGR
ncbi:MAG: hypothetical protein IKH59_10105 [Bacteroidaceae bacterium]|nr:hypothetical protein [Bacteroidaceae bacterium]